MAEPGTIVVLNGTPRSGKSAIARAMQASFDGLWLNLGVDALSHAIPDRAGPGIGLRPGAERPDLEPVVAVLFGALYECVVASSRAGLNVVVDVGHHDDYSTPLDTLGGAARRLQGLPAYLVGVRCPVEVIMARRVAVEPGREGRYVTSAPDGSIPDVVRRWERAVHSPGVYDLQVDTSTTSPERCSLAIGRRLDEGPPSAFAALAAGR